MTYIFLNGDVSDATQVNDNFNKLTKLQGEKAINDVSATNSGVLAGSSQVLIDKFLDSSGQNNTVDTTYTNTTGHYISATKTYHCRYINETPSLVLEPGFETVTGWTYEETDTGFLGAQSTAWKSEGTYSYAITTPSAVSGGAYARIYRTVDFTNIDLLIIDFKRIPANDSAKVKVNNIEIASIPGGESYNNVYDVSGYSGSLVLEFTVSAHNNSASGSLYIDNIRAVNLSSPVYSDSIIQSVATTIPTGMTKVFVTPLMYEALSTGDSIPADVSIDNGSNYTTDVPINEWTPITSANGTSLIVKANLLTGTGATTPKILGWRVLLE